MPERESWGSRTTFILSAIGFAAGIGNLWRFPYLVGKYGGGAFLLFYLLAICLVGVSLFAVEIALGKATKKDPVGAYKKLAPGQPWFINGYINLLAMLLISGYASLVGGWILAYLYKTATGSFAEMQPDEITRYFNTFISNPVEVLAWTIFFIAMLVVVLLQGLKKGIERINKFMLPALFGLILMLMARALTLPGMHAGLSFYLSPDFSKFSLEGALAALGQAFFSVGVAMAAGLVYGSYLPKEAKILSNAAIVGLADTFVAFLAGLIIFPSVAAFGLEVGAGPGLTFITMPNVINQMPLGNLFGPLFYLLFFIAAFTSFIGGMEAIVAHLRDEWHLSRTKGVLVTAALMLFIATFSAISMDLFNALDSFVNNYLLITGGLLMTLFVGWRWPLAGFFREANITSKSWRTFWAVNIKFLIPLIIILIWLSQLGFLD